MRMHAHKQHVYTTQPHRQTIHLIDDIQVRLMFEHLLVDNFYMNVSSAIHYGLAAPLTTEHWTSDAQNNGIDFAITKNVLNILCKQIFFIRFR